MKYKRNSRGKEAKAITKTEENTVARQLESDLQWIDELSSTGKYSFEWVHKIAEELLFQCMGKKEIVVGQAGQQKLVRIFKEKPALEALAMIAKMNGLLFDTVKGNITKSVNGKIEHAHQHTIEMKPNEERTSQVFEILEQCGALKSPVKQIDNSQIVEVYPA